MKVIILAGGSGTRLWPLSRRNFPKQFLKMNKCSSSEQCAFDQGSLIQQTVRRMLQAASPEDILIMTNNDYNFHVKSDVEAVSEAASSNVILEPCKKNTAPAIALALRYCTERLGSGKEEVVFVSPSDHIIDPEPKFVQYLKSAEKAAAEGSIVTFGIKPAYAETGYGYIKCKEQTAKRKGHGAKDIGQNDKRQALRTGKGKGSMPSALCAMPSDSVICLDVEKFVEKPDAETAERYLKEGGYFWNSGMFAFQVGAMEEELKRHAPEIFEKYEKGYDNMLATFEEMPDISIDYAVMERSGRVVTMPMDIYWNDVGSWDSMFEVFPRDDNGNVKIGDVITLDTRNALVISDKRLITALGLEDVIVVETDDAVLVARRGDAQKVKDVVDMLTLKGRKETEEHTTTYRPWGSYTVLEDGDRYKIKRIVVNRGAKLSLQMHHHRSEHWVVIKGTAKVTVGDEIRFIHENESTYIPKSTSHRLENPGKVPLEIIEVQNGEYVEEDDIVRMDDVYGRQKKQ